MGAHSIRWGRVLLGGFLAELILFAAVIPLQVAGSGQAAITALAVIGSFMVFVPVAWWLTRPLATPVLHGMLMGAAAAAIYLVLQLGTLLLVEDAPVVPYLYYVAHALKLAGGATGGWLAQRRAFA
jgi:hypothetical protein